MSEELQQEVVTEPTGTQVAEEPQLEQPKTDVPDENKIEPTGEEGQPVDEKPKGDVQPTQPEPTTEELQKKLKEYELREEERKAIAQRLGVEENVEPDLLNLQSISLQLENAANSEILRACNEYGIDANPERMAESLEKLKAEDPGKYYAFIDRAKTISGNFQRQQYEIAQANYNHGVKKYISENQTLVETIPEFGKIINEYCIANQGSPYIYDELNNITDMAISLIRSGVELGQAYAMQNKAKTDTSSVQGGVGTAQTPVYTSEKIWSRDEIKRMSSDDFAKNESAIMKAYSEGRIQ